MYYRDQFMKDYNKKNSDLMTDDEIEQCAIDSHPLDGEDYVELFLGEQERI